jgi:hypothetical protein
MERTSRWGPAIAEGLHADDGAAEQFDAQVAEALAAVETGVADARGDFPEVGESDLYHDVAGSIAAIYPAEVGAEVLRRIGFDVPTRFDRMGERMAASLYGPQEV